MSLLCWSFFGIILIISGIIFVITFLIGGTLEETERAEYHYSRPYIIGTIIVIFITVFGFVCAILTIINYSAAEAIETSVEDAIVLETKESYEHEGKIKHLVLRFVAKGKQSGEIHTFRTHRDSFDRIENGEDVVIITTTSKLYFTEEITTKYNFDFK